MNEVIMLKYGEIILKGQNKYKFEEVLIKNIRNAVKSLGKAIVKSAQSTIYVSFDNDDADVSAAVDALSKIFGISSLTLAFKGSYDFEEAKKETVEYLHDKLSSVKTFKVISKRADKSYPFNSPQINMLMGGYILEKFPNLTVDVHDPDILVYIEVREGSVFIHANPLRGAGGLPAGTSGHGMLMLSGGLDSPVAGYCLAKRGMRLSAIHFESPPYTSERARLKVEKLAEKLTVYSSAIDLYIVHFTKIQELIKDKCREDLFTIIMRRFMLRIACKVSLACNAKAVITGESLGQVASQTLDAIYCTDAVATIPVFRPLIGTDKQEIVNISYKIDTYDTSIEPYEDCCTVFTPRHPKTKPNLAEIEEEESKLNIDELINEVEIEKTKIN